MQNIKLGSTEYQVLRDLGSGTYHTSLLLELDGLRFVLKQYNADYAGELERQWERWSKNPVSTDGTELVGYLDFGIHEGRPYILRRWVDGESFEVFARRLKIKPSQPEAALEIGQAICRTVARLHDVALVHGHIANANVFFREDGTPLIVDPWLGTPTALTLHLGNQKPGARGCLAPEQQKAGGKVDARTDVWQLGLLLARLYSRKPDIVVNQRIVMELYNAKLPIGLIKVIWQAIQEEPGNRFPDADTLATALAETTLDEHQRTVHVRPIPPPAKGVQGTVSPAIRNTAIFVGTIGLVACALWLFPEPAVESQEPSTTYSDVPQIEESPTEIELPSRIDSGPSPSDRQISQLAPGVDIAFRWVPAGSFIMGSGEGVARSTPRERPVRVVQLTKGFWITETEVTVAQFAAFVESTGYRTTADTEGLSKVWQGGKLVDAQGANWRNPGFSQDGSHPVVCVSWNDAVAFSNWLSGELNVRCSLPTEAQWEYAARAEALTEFATGDGADAGLSEGWFRENSEGRTNPVGTKTANQWGIHDMHGNAWEWCSDWSQENYQSLGTVDPRGPSSGTRRVGRGASWNYSWIIGRSASRDIFRPQNHANFVGFRVVAMP